MHILLDDTSSLIWNSIEVLVENYYYILFNVASAALIFESCLLSWELITANILQLEQDIYGARDFEGDLTLNSVRTQKLENA